jgi:hypothetical protein
MRHQLPGSHHSQLAFTPTSLEFVPRDDLSYAICQVYSLMGSVVNKRAHTQRPHTPYLIYPFPVNR